MDYAGGVNYLAGIGRAIECSLYRSHNPSPLRFVWHHILPVSCGGTTIASNLVQVCDNCHYGIHELLWDLKVNNGVFVMYKTLANTPRGRYAIQGYLAASAMGTLDQIPRQMHGIR